MHLHEALGNLRVQQWRMAMRETRLHAKECVPRVGMHMCGPGQEVAHDHIQRAAVRDGLLANVLPGPPHFAVPLLRRSLPQTLPRPVHASLLV